MKLSTFTTVTLLSTVGAAPPPGDYGTQPVPLERPDPTVYTSSSSVKTDALAIQGALRLAQYISTSGYPNLECTMNNAAVRREWSTLSAPEKKAYIAAVQCLNSKPSKTPLSLAPGAKTRYDDFVATHINQTLTIHGTVKYLLQPNSFKVNLGPVAPALSDVSPNGNMSGLGYNPRCLRRDISRIAASTSTSDDQVSTLITNFTTFASFSTRMQGDFPNGFLGVHTAGHFTVGGDPGGDLFASPGDPFFYFHHTMIDRIWWTWQNLDIEKRQYAIGNTITVNNMPPSRNATLDDVLSLGFLGVDEITIREAGNTLGGPFCYIYE
ncbi:hypothetical protein N0V90_005254 [Kalmusia sp. IMI 367209]|nr:hypothetical protein N0V90_005254 [Kalmusia sp. IMI 367209]